MEKGSESADPCRSDSYLSIESTANHEIKVKGSRFIGMVTPSASVHEAEAIVEKIKKQYHDASHHCFAWRIGTESAIVFRTHDDGEPSGTAGKPICDVLEGRNLTDLLCVVTRYFGGVKLGTGGLVRAYGRCAAETLNRAGVIRHLIETPMTLRFHFDQMGSVMTLLSRYECKIRSTDYRPDPELLISVRRSREHVLCQALMNETAGRVEILKET